jgi:hypothetical protein
MDDRNRLVSIRDRLVVLCGMLEVARRECHPLFEEATRNSLPRNLVAELTLLANHMSQAERSLGRARDVIRETLDGSPS